MGAIKLLDKEINQYLGQLSVQQKEVILSVVKTFAGEEAWLSDKMYITEMDKRFAELETGKVKCITLEELEDGARIPIKEGNIKSNELCVSFTSAY